MYKVYLSPQTQDENIGAEQFRMQQIADVVEQYLLQTGDYAVYRNVINMTQQEIINDSNEVKPDMHVAIHSNYGTNKGIECYVKVGCEKSNGFGKEIYKQVLSIYYDKNVDNGLFYDAKIQEINKVECPAILIVVGNHNNMSDIAWIANNIENIGQEISKGIEKGFMLKSC